ncbi:MAG TPA: DUF1587 domain-containing protein, partial [Pirellulales bacterium]|nr:DUF1587 domain-containing protein [Pirellulales bacterium]
MTWRFLFFVGVATAAWSFAATVAVADPVPFEQLGGQYASHVRPLMARYCLDCHSAADPEGELDLERFASLADVRGAVKIWLKVAEMLANGEMPPKDAPQPAADERKQLRGWVERYLNAEATASAGDPGPVILRRLSNAQYTYTACDLTGVEMDPLREFPSDGAAGEGFTNTGSALVMSPSLLTKYLDAGKAIAEHAVPLPEGFRFSTSTTRRDWTNEILGQIRQLYLDHCDPQRATKVNLQGLTWESNDGGRLPIEHYLEATLAARDALLSSHTSITAVAAERKLNAKYLATLWATLVSDEPSQLLDTLRKRWRAAGPADSKAITEEIAGWQKVLTRFQSVGHMKSWMVAANPLVARHEIRQKLTRPVDGGAVTLYLAVGDAGDGAAGDTVEWRQPRLIAPGRPDLLLRDVREFTREISALRTRIFANTARSLIVVDQVRRATGAIDGAELARPNGVDPEALAAWMDFFGVQSAGKFELDHFRQQIDKVADYEFVRGWGRPETPELLANSSDQHVRIP